LLPDEVLPPRRRHPEPELGFSPPADSLALDICNDVRCHSQAAPPKDLLCTANTVVPSPLPILVRKAQLVIAYNLQFSILQCGTTF
jgi:hypothetical protein